MVIVPLGMMVEVMHISTLILRGGSTLQQLLIKKHGVQE